MTTTADPLSADFILIHCLSFGDCGDRHCIRKTVVFEVASRSSQQIQGISLVLGYQKNY